MSTPRIRIWKVSPKTSRRELEGADRRKAREAAQLLKELRSGWILGGEAFRDRMLDLATAVVGEKKRESFSGEELRAYDESAAKKLLESGLSALGETLGGVRRCVAMIRASKPLHG